MTKLLSVLAAIALACITTTAWAGDDDPFDPAAFAAKPWDVTKSYYSDTGFKNFKGTKRVAVFTAVTFKLDSSVSAVAIDALGGNRTGTAASSMTMALNGVSKEALQRIANGFHDKLVADLTAMGLTIIPPEEYKAAPTYAALAAFDDPSRRQVYIDKNYMGQGKPATLATITAYDQPLFLDSGTGIFKSLGAAIKMSMAMGTDMAIVYANPQIDFVQMSASGGMLAKSAKVSGKPLLQLFTSQIGFVHGYNPAGLTPKRPLISPTDYGATVRKTGSDDRSNWFTGNASSVSTFVVDADEAKYEAAMGELLGFHSDMFIAYLKEKSK